MRLSVIMNHTDASSDPSTVSLKFLAASMRTSWSNGGVRNSSAIALFLKTTEKSGLSWSPFPERILPFSIRTHRPSELSCNLNCAVTFLSFRRFLNSEYRSRVSRMACGIAQRMIENRMWSSPGCGVSQDRSRGPG